MLDQAEAKGQAAQPWQPVNFELSTPFKISASQQWEAESWADRA